MSKKNLQENTENTKTVLQMNRYIPSNISCHKTNFNLLVVFFQVLRIATGNTHTVVEYRVQV